MLLHGIPGWRGTWSTVAAWLAPHCQVIAPDLLGFGDSDDPLSTDFHARAKAEMIARMLAMLEVPRVHLVGFDFGGPVALTVYRTQPERVLSLSLAATNAFTDTPIPGPLKLAPIPVLGPLLFHLLFGRLRLSLMWWGATGDRAAFPYRAYREGLRWPRGVSWTRRIFLASMQNLPGLYREVEDTLAQVRVPSLVLWGDRDPFFPVSVGRRTADAIPGARFEVFPGCGHFVPEERPREFAPHVLSVLR